MSKHDAAAAGACDGVAVDIDRDNFQAMLPTVEKALQECTFFALDCEMTGLFLDGGKEEYLDDMNDRYSLLRNSSHSYMINQFGLSCFKYVAPSAQQQQTQTRAQAAGQKVPEGPGYVASTFNFYIFPEPLKDSGQVTRKFLSDAGSLSFLASQKFDFNKWIYKGISVMPAKDRQKQIREASKYYAGGEVRAPVVPSRPEDVALVTKIVQQVKDWLAGADTMLQLQEMNGFQRLLAFQELRKPQFGFEDYAGFFVRKVATSNGYAHLQLIRGTKAEVKAMEEEDVRERLQTIDAAAGFTRVLEAMRRSQRPAVGHNCMFDIAYVLAACAEPVLPNTWAEYKQLVAEWFPGGLYDTKYLSRMMPEVFDNWTGLGDVFKAVTEEGDKRQRAEDLLKEAAGKVPAAAAAPLALPWLSHAPGFEKYEEVEAGGLAHEAGYDAYMTGSAFACLLPLVQARDAAKAEAEAAAGAGAGVGVGEEEEVVGVLGKPWWDRGTDNKVGSVDAMEVDGKSVGAGGVNGLQGQGSEGDPFKAVVKSVTAAVQGMAVAVQDGMTAVQQGAGGAPAGSTAGGAVDHDPLAGVRRYNGRLNMGRTDMPYAALLGSDPPLDRPQVFYITGLPSNARQAVEEVQRRFQDAGLGRPKVTLQWPTAATDQGAGTNNGAPAALVEVSAAVASTVLSALSAAPWPSANGNSNGNGTSKATASTAVTGAAAGARVTVVPWAEYSAARAAAAAQLQQRPAKRPRTDGPRGEAAGRGRSAAAAGAQGEDRTWCTIM